MIGLRVTDQMQLDSVMNAFQLNQQALEIAQERITTGKNINKPSDDPFTASQAVLFSQRLSLNGQLQKNLDSSKGWLDATDSALGSVDDILQRARQLAIQLSNDTYTATDRQNAANEIHQLLLQAVDVGNSKFGGQYLFSGTKTTTQPFQHDNSAQSPNVSAPGGHSPVIYAGDSGAVGRQTDQAAQLKVNVAGDQLANVFTDLAQLEYDMNNSNARVSGSISGVNPVTGVTSGNPGTIDRVDTFTINGTQVGTRVTLSASAPAALANKTVVGFAPGTAISAVVNQINAQSAQTGVLASIDRNGVLLLQNASAASKAPIIVSSVDQVSTDANGADLTGANGGNPVSTGGDTVHDLGISSNMDNAIGSIDVFALDSSLEHVNALRAQIGAKTNRVVDTQTRLSSLGITLSQLDSKIEDVDMAKAISDLASRQTAFQAALSVAAKTLPPTLLDFLR